MKALTLHQPWATLVARGIKQVETRSWSTTYRGQLAIHASVRQPAIWWQEMVRDDPWCWMLEHHCERVTRNKRSRVEWVGPLGAVVATCDLVDVVPVERCKIGDGSSGQTGWGYRPGNPVNPVICSDQLPYGDFGSGRYMWLLTNIEPLPTPILARGHQRLWNWDDEQ